MEAIVKTYQPKFDVSQLREAIKAEYKEVVCNVNHEIHFTSGRKLAQRLGYSEKTMSYIPEEAIRPFAGVGNPFAMGGLVEGEVILDIGSGGGFDCLYASVISEGLTEIYGLDMTDAMIEQASRNVSDTGVTNIKFIKGYAEEMPFPTASIDLVISNGVINLCPDKYKVYREIYRVLKPGGRFMIGDVMLEKAVPDESRDLIHLWTNCVAGAITQNEYLEIVKSAGFKSPAIKNSYDVFKDARIAKSAAYFGAKGYNIMGRKD